MILNYLKLSFRLMARNPFFTLINGAGLSVGFAVFFVLWQYSESELNSDRQWKDWDRIALLGFFWEWTDDGQIWDSRLFRTSVTSLSSKFANDYSELEEYTRVIYQRDFSPSYAGLTDRVIVHVEDQDGSKRYFKEENMICADANLFTFFSIPVTEGHAETVLLQPNAVVLSQSSAKKLFGQADAMGKMIFINNMPYAVSGVFKDLPHNTHLSFSMVISNQAQVNFWNVVHPVPPCYAYLKSKQPGNWSAFETKINQPQAIQKYWGEVLQQFPNAKGANRIFPLHEVPFSQWSQNLAGSKSKPLLIAFQLISVVVLILAVINYTMLNAARTSTRLKEVATRKVSGASGRDFFKQFLIETIAIFAIAVIMAITIMQLSKTPLHAWLHIDIGKITLNSFLIFVTAVTAAIACCTAYPVFMSRAFQPRALFSTSNNKTGGRKFTLALVQYTCAIVLLVWSFLMYKQVSFILNQNLGFGRENKIVIDGPVVRDDNYETEIRSFANRASEIEGIGVTTISTTSMGEPPSEITVRKPGVGDPVVLDTNGGVDEHFIPLHGLNIVSGRNFLSDEAGNTIILSEGALVRLGFADASSAIGSRIEVLCSGVPMTGEWKSVEVIGVIKGYRIRPLFNYGGEFDSIDRGISLSYKTKLVSRLTPEIITLQVNTHNLAETMDRVRKEYEALFPGNIFYWQLLDENINRHYQSEKTWRNQILVFTLIAIGIACLGLLGMISNKMVEKTKEIGIRKVLGAQMSQITTILLNTTLRQIVFATLIGIPIAYRLTRQYLLKFSEQIDLQWWHFALPVALLVCVMFSVIAGIVWKAVVSNPVEALKHE